MATYTLEHPTAEIPPHPEEGHRWQFRLVLDSGRTIYADEVVELARVLVGPTYPDAGEPLTQLTIERQFASRRRHAIRFAIQTQAVILASLERGDVFDIKRCSAWMRDTLLEPRDRVPRRPLRFWESNIPLVLVASNMRPLTDRSVTLGGAVVVIDDLSDEGLLESVSALSGFRFQRLAGASGY
jgi:hypothetical protein